MLKKYDFLVTEIALLICTLIVIVFAWFNSEYAFIIFVTYLLVELVLVIMATIFSVFSRKREVEVNKYQINSLINTISGNVVIWRSDFKQVIPNENVKTLIGLNAHTPYDTKSILTRLFTEDVFTETGIKRMLENKGDEFYITSADGQQVIIAWNTSILMKSKKYCYFVSIGFDLTERKKMQHELYLSSKSLAQSESRYSLSMELSEIGLMLAEKGKSKYYISDQLKKTIDFPDNYISVENFRKKIHKSDRNVFDTYVGGLMQLGEVSKPHSIELRLLNRDGKYHWYVYKYKATINTEDNFTVGGAFIDITKDKEKDQLIERLAYIDEITGIGNRNRLMSSGQEIYNCAKELNYSYWVMVIDIDKFHIINDICGYNIGNQVLKDFAHIVCKHSTLSSSVSRISGDNFALIIRNYGDMELPKQTIQSIQNDFAKLMKTKFSTQEFTCSGGYALMPRDASSFEGILDCAEFALSSAEKKSSSIVAYDKNMHDKIIDTSELEKELADAIENHELCLYYQPKIEIKTGKIIGVESLIRWVKPDGTVITPNKFIPVAENSPKLITKIGDFVLDEACKQNKLWQDMGYPKIIMSINLTSEDFYQKNIKECILDVLAKTRLEPQWLEVELTESLAMKDIDSALKQMHELRDIGIRLAMDDFGTGHSSLSYINVLPITLLKLDRSFIINLETDEIDKLIVSAIINIAKCKHIETIAEGMENPEQVRILRELGCDFAQGYLYGKPMPPEKLQEYFEENAKNPKKY